MPLIHLQNGSGTLGTDGQIDVLLVVDQFPRSLGGGERVLLKLAGLLPQYGFRCAVLTFFVHPESRAAELCPCDLYVLPLQRTYDLHACRAALELGRFLRRRQVKIVQTFFESSDLWAGAVTKMFSDAKLIWSRRDMGILRGRKHALAYRLLAGMPDRVFAVSEQVRQQCIEVDGIDPAKVETIYNGLNLTGWSAHSRGERAANGAAVIATVGNIRRVKGHDVLIRAAAIVAAAFPSVQFSIAGEVLEPEYFAELQGLLAELDLTGRLHFAGNIADLPTYLSTADIFVLPSRSEGFSNALIEAMAASLPVVATRVGGNPEAVQNDVSGLLVPPDDPQALADALIRLLSDTAGATEMGLQGRRIAESLFTTEAMMARITAAYRRLLSEA